MFNGSKAWMEVIKLGPAAKLSKETNDFYRNIVVKIFQDEGLFDYLIIPHSIEDIAAKFSYTDKDLLKEVLDAFLKHKILRQLNGYYQTDRPIVIKDIKPRLLNQGNMDLSLNFVKFLPERLRGAYYTSTSEFNLYSFEEALTNRLYRQVRKTVLAFSDVLSTEGRFLDLGTGSGVGLAHIFALYMQRGALDRKNVTLELYGIDIDEGLLKIADEEFFRNVSKETGSDEENLQRYWQFKPSFKIGTATKISYPDNYFDSVYISQVLHWTDPEKSINEMYRVTKENGAVIGGQVLMPNADIFMHLMMKVIKGAYGFFTRAQMKAWAIEAGFKKVAFSTPITAFIFKK